MDRTPEQWDCVSAVMEMARDDGNLPEYFSEPRCDECGSGFPGHRCHLEAT
jgi:hypothetical protein